VVLVLLTAVPARLEAHATLLRTQPAAEEVLVTAPAQIRFWFSERLEPLFHAVRITNDKTGIVPTQDPRVDKTDPTLLIVPLSPLPPGSYQVGWRVLSRDGHVAEGSFSFTIQP
jgi:methionine-rich copper-binding protein CopC